jgi:hypothetical protein
VPSTLHETIDPAALVDHPGVDAEPADAPETTPAEAGPDAGGCPLTCGPPEQQQGTSSCVLPFVVVGRTEPGSDRGRHERTQRNELRVRVLLHGRRAEAKAALSAARTEFFERVEAGKALVAAEARLKEEEAALTAVRNEQEQVRRQWAAAVEAGDPTEDLDARQPELTRRAEYHAARLDVLRGAVERARETARAGLLGHLRAAIAGGEKAARAGADAALARLRETAPALVLEYLAAKQAEHGFRSADLRNLTKI